MSENENPEAPAPKTKARKLSRAVDYENGVVTFTVLATGATLTCAVNDLPAEIQAKLLPLAINHRIGDAAAGRDGDEAFDSMTKVWEALKSGDFSVRASAGPKMPTKTQINEAMNNLSPKEQAAAQALLAKLGVAVG